MLLNLSFETKMKRSTSDLVSRTKEKQIGNSMVRRIFGRKGDKK
jgi:hypothetical protein